MFKKKHIYTFIYQMDIYRILHLLLTLIINKADLLIEQVLKLFYIVLNTFQA
jgi:hypothetical protein